MVFDRLRPDEVNRAVSVYDYASGKSVNVARVLRTLGEDAFATGFAGGDRGAALVRDLDAAGVGNAFVTVAAPTRQCVTVIDRTARTATELVEESLPVGDEDWSRLGEQLDRLLTDASALVLSGSLPPGAPDDFYLSCLRRVTRAAMPVVLDTRGEPLRHALRHGGFVVKLNRDELAMTVGRALAADADVIRAARETMPRGGAAVVTLGAGGAIATAGGAAWRVGVPAVETRSAVGSGDAFSAGLVMGLVRREALPDACAWGAACGAANAMTDLAGHLSAADVDAIRGGVSVTPF
jgi:1-phosphofructokinase family hexose kinase